MTLYEFKCLDEMEQAEAVWNGVHLANREDDDHRILLYQIDGFYVEVFYHKAYNVIRRIRSFSNVGSVRALSEADRFGARPKYVSLKCTSGNKKR